MLIQYWNLKIHYHYTELHSAHFRRTTLQPLNNQNHSEYSIIDVPRKKKCASKYSKKN